MTEVVQATDAASDWPDQRIAELEAELQRVQAENAGLKGLVAEWQRRIAELERAGNRPATPFARSERKTDPKRPGRKAGQGPFSYRARPTPEEVGETKEAPLDGCWVKQKEEGQPPPRDERSAVGRVPRVWRAVDGCERARAGGDRPAGSPTPDHALCDAERILRSLPSARAATSSGADFGSDGGSGCSDWTESEGLGGRFETPARGPLRQNLRADAGGLRP